MFLQTLDRHSAHRAGILILHSLLQNIPFCSVLSSRGVMFARSISVYTGVSPPTAARAAPTPPRLLLLSRADQGSL